jgi:hypothetical protein
VNTELGVAPCNGTAQQAFWMFDYTFNLRSAFNVSTGPGTCAMECLDVLYDVELAGTGLDNFNCNGSNAQWFKFTKDHRIKLANDESLCVGVTGPFQGDVAPIALVNCEPPNGTKMWFLSNTPNGARIATVSAGNPCLDVLYGSATPATPVNAAACNPTAAQRWSPELAVPTCFVP